MRWFRLFLLVAFGFVPHGHLASAGADEAVGNPPRFRVLVFSKTSGFRHSSIPEGIAAVRKLGKEQGFAVEATEDAAAFTDANLATFDAVIFLNTTGDVLSPAEQDVLEHYVVSGGGWVGIHAAADTEYDWPWYRELVGAYFQSHPKNQQATLVVADRAFPATRHLPARWERLDEWYNYRANPRGDVHVLMTLDERSYEGGEMGFDHPIAWAHEVGDGRAFYTGLGHTEASYQEPLFLQHLLGGIEWAAGQAEGDAGATITANFEKVVLEDEVTDAMELDVAADGRVFWIERQGPIRVWDPETGQTHLAGTVPSLMVIEDGASGLALDPNFMENGWLYVYYTPATGEPNRLSRFTYRDGQIGTASEKVILEVPVQRDYCCHTAGYVAFGPDGTLWLSTGNNTHNTDPTRAPLNELPGFDFADSQRTSSNTNDLRGKVLRIRPLPDGTYETPEGNLFEPDDTHRGEIYTMGHRNPWRFSVDPATGWVYIGDVGLGNPPDPDRGPWGWEEINQARGPAFFGWPYFAGPNEPYRDYDPKTMAPGPPFDAARPVNDSPNNTGARELPPAQPALIWYTYGPSDDFPELGAGGMSAAAGPVYRRPGTAGPHALPAYYEATFFAYEWMRNWIMEVKLDENGDLLKINPFLPGMAFSRPTDIKVGPDGALYVIEWGGEFWGSNADAQIVRLEYRRNDRTAAPVAGAPRPEEQRDQASALAFSWPMNGGFFEYGEPIPYTVTAPDGEAVQVNVFTGHDTHEHLAKVKTGAKGTATVDRTTHVHYPDLHLADRFVVLEASQGDETVRVKLHPKRLGAEYASERTASRVSLGGHPAGKGYAETVIIALEGADGEWAAYSPVNLANVQSLTFRLKPLAESTMEVRHGGANGPMLGRVVLDSVAARTMRPVVLEEQKLYNVFYDEAMQAHAGAYVPDPAVYEGWYEVIVPVAGAEGADELFLVFRGEDGGPLVQLDWIQFNGPGVARIDVNSTR